MSGLILLLLYLPRPVEMPVRVDLIEFNQRVWSDGENTFNQWIAWDWSIDRFVVRDWCTYGSARLTRRGENYILTRRNQNGKLTEVIAPDYRHTITMEDPEVEDRKVLPIRFRCKIWN